MCGRPVSRPNAVGTAWQWLSGSMILLASAETVTSGVNGRLCGRVPRRCGGDSGTSLTAYTASLSTFQLHLPPASHWTPASITRYPPGELTLAGECVMVTTTKLSLSSWPSLWAGQELRGFCPFSRRNHYSTIDGKSQTKASRSPATAG
jgi:hypothetical protein